MKKMTLCVLAVVAMLSCGENRAVIKLITKNAPRGTATIEATIEIDGTIYSTDKIAPYTDVDTETNRFLFTYPVNATGSTKISLKALTMDRCEIGTAFYKTEITNFEPMLEKTVTFDSHPRVESSIQSLLGIWGSKRTDKKQKASDIWAVGANGTLFHWDGVCWTDWQNATITTSASFNKSTLAVVDGIRDSDVWVVGENQTFGHWDGAAWNFNVMKTGTLNPGTVTALRVFSSNDAWVTGLSGASFILYSWDGQSWIDRKNISNTENITTDVMNTVGQKDQIYAIAGTNSADMMLAGFSRSKSLGNEMPGLMTKCKSVGSGCSKNGVDQNTAFYPISLGTGADITPDYTAAWTASENDYWFGVGYDDKASPKNGARVVHWLNGTLNQPEIIDLESTTILVDYIWGTKNTDGLYDIWVNVYYREVMDPLIKSRVYRKKNNGPFELQTDGRVTGKTFTAIWGSSDSDVWLVGLNGLRVHWDGEKYTTY